MSRILRALFVGASTLMFLAFGQSPLTGLRITVNVKDSQGSPIPAVLIQLQPPGGALRSAETDDVGRLSFTRLVPGTYSVTAIKAGFEKLTRTDVNLDSSLTAPLSVDLTLLPEIKTTKIEVQGTVESIEEPSSQPNRLPPSVARELPTRPTTVADALPYVPGVVRVPGGGLILSSSPEHRAALIVNSADVTDPATGQFGVTIPIDSVDVLNVYQTAYLAEYGRFTAGLVSVETKRGGEKWKLPELNDPLPEFRIRSWHLRGLKTATPRLNFDGPLIRNKLYIIEGFEYAKRNTAVYELPFPYNQKVQQGINSFTQLDWIQSAKHIITATLHLAPQRQSGLTLDFFNPLPTSPDSSTHSYTGTIFDRLTLLGGQLENRFGTTKYDAAVWGKGPSQFNISPTGNTGNFFADQTREATRISGASTYTFAPIQSFGTHQIKMGGYFASSEHTGDILERPIDLLDSQQRLIERITFARSSTFEVDDLEKSFFGQDHWIVNAKLALDVGLRTESQQISGAFRVAPRIGLSYAPFTQWKTVFRGGFGLFYERVPLNVYGFNRYPDRTITYYDENGNVSSGPYVYLNTLGQNRVRFPFTNQKPIDGNFSPRSQVWSVQLEQPVSSYLKIRATYLENLGDGLIELNRLQPAAGATVGAFLLEGTGASRYRQFDVIGEVKLREDRRLFLSYTRSHAVGDINDFGRFLGTVPAPIVRNNTYTLLGTDLPNRFLAWGVLRFPYKFQMAPVIEYRTGFPYSNLDALQNFSGLPNSQRFPNFMSADSRFSKDFQVNPKYAVRLSLSVFNLTNHFNPEAVHNNIADPAVGYFFGHRGRRFTVDFDFLF